MAAKEFSHHSLLLRAFPCACCDALVLEQTWKLLPLQLPLPLAVGSTSNTLTLKRTFGSLGAKGGPSMLLSCLAISGLIFFEVAHSNPS